ncbi:predicted protein [Sclerotinia sclerotiorum 1980 UF-70]|uniref:Uncharacterized protein n=1 Tax=Sclerotinia sclerotiorum (strain ATCC 18683 / 1980 / Ss-1) TaxID=665079 RepID=A7E583_SCLS1|nr:predicted protein [Sclerotinia sclerotiorum 1980 UF-70]EDN91055.1 predicted protein [Sclerotinia sclerotiorum 1980 UF-70]
MALLMSPTLFLRNVEKNIRILKGGKTAAKDPSRSSSIGVNGVKKLCF